MRNWTEPKDPEEVFDLGFDWSLRLEDDEQIAESEVFVDEGSVEVERMTVSGALVLFWVTGGDPGVTNRITNRITTSAGRTYDWTGRLRVRER